MAAALKARIIRGEWPPGSAIPAEQSLADQHGVALGTMRRALELLSEQGFLDRQHGRGTFVKPGLSGAPMFSLLSLWEGGDTPPQSSILARQTRPPRPRWPLRWGWGRAKRSQRQCTV